MGGVDGVWMGCGWGVDGVSEVQKADLWRCCDCDLDGGIMEGVEVLEWCYKGGKGWKRVG